MFLNQLNKHPNNNQRFFYFDDYIVETSENEIRFGVAGGHSGGYWFVPTITELDGKTIFNGTIQYVDHYSGEKGIKKHANKIEEILYYYFVMIARKNKDSLQTSAVYKLTLSIEL